MWLAEYAITQQTEKVTAHFFFKNILSLFNCLCFSFAVFLYLSFVTVMWLGDQPNNQSRWRNLDKKKWATRKRSREWKKYGIMQMIWFLFFSWMFFFSFPALCELTVYIAVCTFVVYVLCVFAQERKKKKWSWEWFYVSSILLRVQNDVVRLIFVCSSIWFFCVLFFFIRFICVPSLCFVNTCTNHLQFNYRQPKIIARTP